MLTILDSLPEGLLLLSATQLHTLLPGPTLIHLEGRRGPPVFVSVLQHGNEHTGWEAVRRLLSDYQNETLPRSLSLFIGNVAAARYNQRFLEEQYDFNRAWGSSEGLAHPIMQHVMDIMRTRGVFLSVDVHNNTGKNPHYACVNRTGFEYLHLARLFSRTVVYFIRPEGVQSMAFAQFCPAVTIECGLSGEKSGTDHVYEYLDACLHLTQVPSRPIQQSDINLYHTVAVAKVPAELSLGFSDTGFDVCLDEGLEYFNFCELAVGTKLGNVAPGITMPLDIRDEGGCLISDDYVVVDNGELITRRTFIPAMITPDITVIRKDCLCYLMEHYPLPNQQ